jgi:MFS family permease
MSKAILKIGVLSMSMLSMSALVITSAFGAMFHYFKDIAPSTIQMLASLPSLGSLITTLLVGWLASRISKKTLALIGIVLIGCGGLIPTIYFSNIFILLFCSLLLGLGVGFITTVSPMLLTHHFTNNEDRAAIMGMNTAISALGVMLLMIMGGYLGRVEWSHTYYVYASAIIIFISVLIFVPKDVILRAETSHESSNQKFSVLSLNKKVYVIAFLTFLTSFLYTIFMSNISILLLNKNIGGTDITGLINAVGTLGGLAAGFTIKQIRKYISTKTMGIGFLFLVLSFGLVLYSNSMALLLIGSICSGVAMCLIMCTAPYEISLIVSHKEIAPAMSLFIFFSSFGGVLSPMVMKVMGISVGEKSFYVGFILTLFTFLSLMLSRFEFKLHPKSITE